MTDDELEKLVEELYQKHFYGRLFLRSERRIPRKLKKRIVNNGMTLTAKGLKVL
jgi:hypothetical protein